MNHNVHNRNRLFLFLIIYIVIILLPYVIAAVVAGESHVFAGFLLNPIDGNSYLAKMRQGFSGAWEFSMPFTKDPGEGAYIFLFYLLIGHLSRLTGLPLIIMFHVMRLAGSCFFLFSLWKFFVFIFEHEPIIAWRAFLLSTAGSGLGWLIFLSGYLPADFWVAEAYPFLSSFANPHFPIGLGLLLWILILGTRRDTPLWLEGILALLLGIILPFGVVIACMVLSGKIVVDYLNRQQPVIFALIIVLLFGGGMILYQVRITMINPVFAEWNRQNLTPAPPVWDFFLSFLPALALAIVGIKSSLSSGLHDRRILLSIWLVGAIVLVWLPVNLQRRFMLGLYIPISGLAVSSLSHIAKRYEKSTKKLFRVLFLFSIPTNLVLILATIVGALDHNPAVYLTKAEDEALAWLSSNAGDSLVLASPDMGLFIPGKSDCRVLYGHPFETVNAEFEKKQVELFFSDELSLQDSKDFISRNQVDYIFFGDRESEIGRPKVIDILEPVMSEGEAILYSTENIP